MAHVFALLLAILWTMVVVLGTLGRKRAAAVMAGAVSVAAGVPYMPRFAAYLIDSDAFIVRYGAAAVREAEISGVCVMLALVALIAAPLSERRAWGWLLPAGASFVPVALFVWVAFWFTIRF